MEMRSQQENWGLASCVEDSSNLALLPCRLRGWGLQCQHLWRDALRAGASCVETQAPVPQGQHSGLLQNLSAEELDLCILSLVAQGLPLEGGQKRHSGDPAYSSSTS